MKDAATQLEELGISAEPIGDHVRIQLGTGGIVHLEANKAQRFAFHLAGAYMRAGAKLGSDSLIGPR